MAPSAAASRCHVLLVSPQFDGRSLWNFQATFEVLRSRAPAPPLGLLTVAALLPPTWQCRLVNRNFQELTEVDLDWADLVMTGGMQPQRPDLLRVVDLAQARGKPVVVGGPDPTSSPEVFEHADFRVLGEAEGIIGEFIAAWEGGARRGTFIAEKFAIDVTRTPIPRYDLINARDYTYLGVQFARGCPFTCEFCDIIELYGRVPRVKTVEQMLAELDTLYRLGHRGHVDFVDDNFIGNKKAVKAFLPHLIAWQKAHDYPFEFSTEASINLADDDALLAMMREANFFVVFVGIESPDTDTLMSMQKKQNTRRSLAKSVHKIYGAGMFVCAGFIIGFDSERDNVAEEMVECIEATSIPVCSLGLLYALPNTQLTRRLEREGRLFPAETVAAMAANGVGDQCTMGLNFHTLRPRRDIMMDYRAAMGRIYRLKTYYGRLRTTTRMVRRPLRRSPYPGPQLASVALRDLQLVTRLFWLVLRRQPRAFPLLLGAFLEAVVRNPGSLRALFTLAALYLHLGPFAQHVVAALDRRLAALDAREGPEYEITAARAPAPVALLAGE